MPQVRLIGLVLFVTAVFLTLVAAMTQTSHIRLKQPGRMQAAEQPAQPHAAANGPLDSQPNPPEENAAPKVAFISIPILWPLAIAGCLGLILWFSTTPFTPAKPTSRRRGRSRRRKR
ncbi:MAG: hypothetical protein R3C53_07410 [Pirellulaceae bacterium]